MKSTSVRKIIERVADEPGIPENLSREIAGLAHRHLKAAGRGRRPQHSDITRALEKAWSEWSDRLWTALDSMTVAAAG